MRVIAVGVASFPYLMDETVLFDTHLDQGEESDVNVQRRGKDSGVALGPDAEVHPLVDEIMDHAKLSAI